MTGAYKLHNFVTGHYYIGASLDVFERYTQHLKDIAKRDKPKRWQKAWDKHPELLDLDTWECLVLQEFETLEEALALETKLLAEHIRQNLCLNAYKTTGKSHTQEARDKISEANSNPSEETREKKSVAKRGELNPMYEKSSPMKGKEHTDQAKEKMKGPRPSITGELNPMYGKTRSDETKEKIREKLRGKMAGENSPHYGKKRSPETIAKMKATIARKKAERENAKRTAD